jgi:hypothetical protein
LGITKKTSIIGHNKVELTFLSKKYIIPEAMDNRVKEGTEDKKKSSDSSREDK